MNKLKLQSLVLLSDKKLTTILHLAYFLEISKVYDAFTEHVRVRGLGTHTKRSG